MVLHVAPPMSTDDSWQVDFNNKTENPRRNFVVCAFDPRYFGANKISFLKGRPPKSIENDAYSQLLQ